ncbi:MAG TPA: ABC transporter ATP-binding protein/permease [Candidatus Egerieisoma faecipullorum]|uniref:ABC transporter ATP-binding protein/permease n=1 Tax=Candidatus Egerieisoma faecipullorum TaxID=2840963 RepID=A0A9D1I6Z5_9CLOT|nr:ABC transporter ATP-binding protein/permease [Candidatus Egerieisoma faecipullorum]
MLKLNQITKTYTVGDLRVEALKGITVEFRKSEFVSVLGPSGCGKTTLLNIIGGLDQYTSGDLVINDISTKEYKDSDWDAYRNHRIGFVFQNYNLISHQNVQSNVELALTLSGVSKSERKKRAMEALEKVGLSDQAHKKPNQMSGGQMQRVAIARALVNNPDILLADEPTGALDSETSVQIMEILKEISKEKLVIMVTHNPELAARYSTRIIRLLDGTITDDTDPYTAARVEPLPKEKRRKTKEKNKKQKTSMSFFTALSLSLNNLMTKKARTFMTSFAGSIGIIGIALILALSSGVNAYVKRVEADTLSSYPLTIEASTMDMTGIMSAMLSTQKDEVEHGADKIYSNDLMTDILETMSGQVIINNLEAFKTYLEDPASGFSELVSDIQYNYSTPLNIYKADTSEGVLQVNPSQVLTMLGLSGMSDMTEMSGSSSSMSSSFNVWTELMDNEELLESQYDVLYGSMPQAYDEAVIIVDKNNEISDYTLYALGIKSPAELEQMMKDIMAGNPVEVGKAEEYTYEYLCSLSYKLLLSTDYYSYDEESNRWIDRSSDTEYLKSVIEDDSRGIEVKIVGILRQADDTASSTAVRGSVAYRSDLMEALIEKVNESEIVKDQNARPDTDVFTGKKFTETTGEESGAGFDVSMLTPEEQEYFMSLTDEEKAEFASAYMAQNATSSATLEGNLEKMGVADLDKPSAINIYPVDFESKEEIVAKIEEYNGSRSEADEIQYTDYISIMMSSVTTIINAISYILIAFVAISLIVSSIMIGIITYISVLERTKEIGILRSIGASKRDISRVFNAETLIVGFAAGIIGIGITLLLTIPVNVIIHAYTGISGMAALPWLGAIILVAISMLLTFIAGLIPSRFAAKKDPVEALRSE